MKLADDERAMETDAGVNKRRIEMEDVEDDADTAVSEKIRRKCDERTKRYQMVLTEIGGMADHDGVCTAEQLGFSSALRMEGSQVSSGAEYISSTMTADGLDELDGDSGRRSVLRREKTDLSTTTTERHDRSSQDCSSSNRFSTDSIDSIRESNYHHYSFPVIKFNSFLIY